MVKSDESELSDDAKQARWGSTDPFQLIFSADSPREVFVAVQGIAHQLVVAHAVKILLRPACFCQ